MPIYSMFRSTTFRYKSIHMVGSNHYCHRFRTQPPPAINLFSTQRGKPLSIQHLYIHNISPTFCPKLRIRNICAGIQNS